MPTPKRSPWWSKITRDLVLFGAGLGFFAYEVIVAKAAPELVIPVIIGMLGLPVWLRSDERKQKAVPEPEPEDVP